MFDSLDLAIELEALPAVSFHFSDEFVAGSVVRLSSTRCQFTFCDPLGGTTYVGGVLTEPHSTILVGTLSFSVEGAPVGVYQVLVDTIADGFSGLSLAGDVEPVVGSAQIVVNVPEPATVLCLAAGALVSVFGGVTRRLRRR